MMFLRVAASRWQDASLCYDPGSAPPEVQSDSVFREGQTPGGSVTYTPRLIAMDLKGTRRSGFAQPEPGARPDPSVCLHRKSPDVAAGRKSVRPRRSRSGSCHLVKTTAPPGGHSVSRGLQCWCLPCRCQGGERHRAQAQPAGEELLPGGSGEAGCKCWRTRTWIRTSNRPGSDSGSDPVFVSRRDRSWLRQSSARRRSCNAPVRSDKPSLAPPLGAPPLWCSAPRMLHPLQVRWPWTRSTANWPGSRRTTVWRVAWRSGPTSCGFTCTPAPLP